MRKYLHSAIFLHLMVLASAIVFVLAFLAFGLGADRPTLNVSLMFVMLLVVDILLLVLWRQTLQREVLIRRFYVSSEWIYNHEIGYAPLSRIVPDGNAFDFVTFAAEALARMSYGFGVADTPESFIPLLVIESNAFIFHTASNDPDDGVVVDTWTGTLRKIDEPGNYYSSFTSIGTFSNAGELACLIEESGVMDSDPQDQGAAD